MQAKQGAEQPATVMPVRGDITSRPCFSSCPTSFPHSLDHFPLLPYRSSSSCHSAIRISTEYSQVITYQNEAQDRPKLLIFIQHRLRQHKSLFLNHFRKNFYNLELYNTNMRTTVLTQLRTLKVLLQTRWVQGVEIQYYCFFVSITLYYISSHLQFPQIFYYLPVKLEGFTDRPASATRSAAQQNVYQFAIQFDAYNNNTLERMGKAGGQGKKGSSSKRSYSRISLKRRKMLIMMVFKEGFSIAKAIKKLGLKLTTARFIIQKFKESGTFPMKQFKKNSRMLRDLVEGPLAPEPGPVKVEEALSLEAVKIEEKEEEEAGDAGEQLPQLQPLTWFCFHPFLLS